MPFAFHHRACTVRSPWLLIPPADPAAPTALTKGREAEGVAGLDHCLQRLDLWHFDVKQPEIEIVADDVGFSQVFDSHLGRRAHLLGGGACASDVPFANGAMLSIDVDEIMRALFDRSLYLVPGRMVGQSHLADRLAGVEPRFQCTLTRQTHTPIMFCFRFQSHGASTEQGVPGGNQPGMKPLKRRGQRREHIAEPRQSGPRGLRSPVPG